ncbi:MAG TPA: O-acetyl-ADP-ribose deacetylase [Acidobacteriota bacterium]|nr:O-acetyl-ADP-ribose deacetylase [Acidobacteriota bacterium]
MERLKINGSILELVQGDITAQRVDAIVNAANSALAGGGGVDGAIHQAGGPSIMEECRRFDGCPTGSAVVTGAGHLKAKNVIHAVGPIWRGGGRGEPELLAGAYAACMKITAELGHRSIAFPSISTGAYGYPVEAAAEIALRTVADHLRGETSVEVARFVLFDSYTLAAYTDAMGKLHS